MASIEQWKLSRAWTIWDETRDPDGADEHIERTCTNLCQLKDGLELNGFLDTCEGDPTSGPGLGPI